MLYFLAFGCCLLSLAFVFAVIVPLSLKLIHKISGKKIKLNLATGIFIFFLTFIVSIWIFAQLFLVVSGDVEEAKDNVLSLLSIIDLFKIDRFLPHLLKLTKLSLQYDVYAFIWKSIAVTSIYGFPIFWYYKKTKKPRNKTFVICFVLLAIFSYCTIPLSIIEDHDKAIKIAQASENVRNEQARKDTNTQIYKHLKPTELLSRYEGCYEAYRWLEGVPYYKATETFYKCQQTEKFCLGIRSLYDVNNGSKEDLVGDKALCDKFGWYGSSKRYSKDFNLN